MADERDPRVTRRYRELGAEEPPRELDQHILAAAHRAADRPHAPLVTPAGRHRWYFSLAAAAILVLAVAVTVHMDRSRPDADYYTFSDGVLQQAPPAPEAPPAARVEPQAQASPPERRYGFASEPKPSKQKAPKEFARDAAPATLPPSEPADRRRESVDVARSDRPEARQQQAPPVEEPQRAPPPAVPSDQESAAADALATQGLLSRQMQAGRSREAAPNAKPAPGPAQAPQARADARVAAVAVPLTPERLLERIAELRKEGRHGEADQLLAEFRQRYPDYRISEEMLQKVERKK